MQPPTVREVIKMLEDDGFALTHMVGSHRRYAKGSQRVTVPGKPSDHLKPGTWISVQKQAGWR